MAKNILIFADGTGQIGGIRPDQRMTNIYKLYRAMRSGSDSPIDPRLQVAFYDPGIGTATSDGRVNVSVWDRIRSVLSMITGLGFSGNVIDCYESILKCYEPGDRIYLFGFSRGGYTARAVANVLNLCGVPREDGRGAPLPRAGKQLRRIAEEAVLRVYNHGAGKDRKLFFEQREQLAREFRLKYQAGAHPDRGDVYPEGIAVFDAVAALGFPVRVRLTLIAIASLVSLAMMTGIAYLLSRLLNVSFLILALLSCAALVVGLLAVLHKNLGHSAPVSVPEPKKRHWAIWSSEHYDLDLDGRTEFVRHALAIDEDRKSFARVGWGRKGCDYGTCVRTGRHRYVQMWFAGNHSDIGGSYPEEESRLSDITLDWMLGELQAHDAGLQFDVSKLQRFPDALGVQHSALADWADAHPRVAGLIKRHAGGGRVLPEIAELHPSVLERLHAPEVLHRDLKRPYRPDNLKMVAMARDVFVEGCDCPTSINTGLGQ